MQNTDVNVISYMVNSAGMLLLLLCFIGLNIKLSQIVVAVLAYPVYLALFALESSFKRPVARNFIMLNIPESNPKRFFMNFCACMVLIGLSPNVFQFYLALSMSEVEQAKTIIDLIFGNSNYQFWCNLFSVFFVFLIYLISYKTKIDERDAWEKIESLTVPSLWKGVFKKLQ